MTLFLPPKPGRWRPGHKLSTNLEESKVNYTNNKLEVTERSNSPVKLVSLLAHDTVEPDRFSESRCGFFKSCTAAPKCNHSMVSKTARSVPPLNRRSDPLATETKVRSSHPNKLGISLPKPSIVKQNTSITVPDHHAKLVKVLANESHNDNFKSQDRSRSNITKGSSEFLRREISHCDSVVILKDEVATLNHMNKRSISFPSCRGALDIRTRNNTIPTREPSLTSNENSKNKYVLARPDLMDIVSATKIPKLAKNVIIKEPTGVTVLPKLVFEMDTSPKPKIHRKEMSRYEMKPFSILESRMATRGTISVPGYSNDSNSSSDDGSDCMMPLSQKETEKTILETNGHVDDPLGFTDPLKVCAIRDEQRKTRATSREIDIRDNTKNKQGQQEKHGAVRLSENYKDGPIRDDLRLSESSENCSNTKCASVPNIGKENVLPIQFKKKSVKRTSTENEFKDKTIELSEEERFFKTNKYKHVSKQKRTSNIQYPEESFDVPRNAMFKHSDYTVFQHAKYQRKSKKMTRNLDKYDNETKDKFLRVNVGRPGSVTNRP